MAEADNPSDELAVRSTSSAGSIALHAALVAAPLAGRRSRSPSPLIGAFSAFASRAGLIVLFTVAVHRRFSAVLLVVRRRPRRRSPIYIWLHPDATDPFWVSLVFIVLVTVATVAWGMFVRARRQLVLSLRERAERAEAEQQLRVEQARQHERARIAREMHDVLAHRISLLSMHAGALEFRPDAPPEEVARAAGDRARERPPGAAGPARGDRRAARGAGVNGGGPERPQPTLANLPALLEESREAGMHVSAACRVGRAGGGARRRRPQRLPDRAGGR